MNGSTISIQHATSRAIASGGGATPSRHGTSARALRAAAAGTCVGEAGKGTGAMSGGALIPSLSPLARRATRRARVAPLGGDERDGDREEAHLQLHHPRRRLGARDVGRPRRVDCGLEHVDGARRLAELGARVLVGLLEADLEAAEREAERHLRLPPDRLPSGRAGTGTWGRGDVGGKDTGEKGRERG
jgi:hypothetical protein